MFRARRERNKATPTYIVRAKCIVLDDNLVALIRGSVKRAQQEVHVDRQRVHDGHLVRRLGADELGGQTGDRLVNVRPRARATKVTLDAARRPLLHFLVQIGLRAPRLQTERVAAEVDAAFAVGIAGDPDEAWRGVVNGKALRQSSWGQGALSGEYACGADNETNRRGNSGGGIASHRGGM